MSVIVHQLKREPIDLSDSDSDRLQIEESSSTCDVEEEPWVRRSSRRRRTSTRFSDFFTGEEESFSRKLAPAPKTVRTPSTVKKPKHEPTMPYLEPIDPKFLIAYVEKTKKNVSPGQYAVKLPVGPDEYVTVDGAEYLNGLGYSLIEEEVVEPERFSKRVVFEAQRAMMTKSPPNHRSSPASHEASSSPSKSFRIKEVYEPDQFSSASAYSSDEDRDSDETVEIIDIMGPSSPPRRIQPIFPAPPLPRAVPGDIPVPVPDVELDRVPRGARDVRDHHNLMEQQRRKLMADQFLFLKQCVVGMEDTFPFLNEDGEHPNFRAPKVKILAEATRVIAELQSRASMSTALLESLRATNLKRKNRFAELLSELKWQGQKKQETRLKQQARMPKKRKQSIKAGKIALPAKKRPVTSLKKQPTEATD